MKIYLFIFLLPFYLLAKGEYNFEHLSLEDGLSQSTIQCIYQDRQGFLWFGTTNGLNRYDGYSFSVYHHNPSNTSSLSSDMISTINEDPAGNLWIGTEDGVNLYNRSSNTFTRYCENDLIISIMNKGDFLNTFSNSLAPVRYSPLFDKLLNKESINTIFQDRSGILWFGSAFSGIYKLSLHKNKFTHYKQEPDKKNSLLSNFVYSLLKDHRGNIWVGSTEGLTVLNPTSGETKYYTGNRKEMKLSHSFVTFLFEDKEKNTWVGTRNGLNLFDSNGAFRKSYYPTSPEIFRRGENFVAAMHQDKQGDFWVLTGWAGLKKFDMNGGKFTQVFSLKPDTVVDFSFRYYSLIEDRSGIFWIGTQQGLVKFNPSNNEFTHYQRDEKNKHSLSNQFVFTTYEDDLGRIWVGTYGGGLNMLNVKSGKFSRFSEEEGLPNNVVYGILPDEFGNIWLSTNKGICRFNTTTFQIRNFDISDGLQSYEFNSGAFYRSADGELFFGGLNGFNSFYPSLIKDNTHTPPIAITAVKVFDNPINVASGTLELPYNKNFISIDFVALDFVNPRKNRYRYKLEGFDKEVVYSGTRRFVTYTNLEPGTYHFKVSGSNNDDVWNEAGAELLLIINPPFWRTWWFYLLTFASGVVMIFSIHRYRVRYKLNQLFQIEQMRKRIADDFHDELGHKLTKISLYTELMKRDMNGKLNGYEEYIVKINETANKLYDDTKDFIWSIDPGKDTLFDLAVYLKDFGDELFDKTGIAFRVSEIQKTLEKILLPMNWKRQLTLLFKEAMNNILKHSGGTVVELEVTFNGFEVGILLTDDGSGLSASASGSKGRGLTNMHNRAQKIGGTLVVNSTGKGTVIKFNGIITKPHTVYETN